MEDGCEVLDVSRQGTHWAGVSLWVTCGPHLWFHGWTHKGQLLGELLLGAVPTHASCPVLLPALTNSSYQGDTGVTAPQCAPDRLHLYPEVSQRDLG